MEFTGPLPQAASFAARYFVSVIAV